MKTSHLSIIAFTMLLLVPVMINNPVKALCVPNSDWPEAPCYGCSMCIPSMEKQREDWMPYYQYNGMAWMEMMKTKMENAIKNGTLQEWVGFNQANYDVWRYYYLNNQAPFFTNSTVPEFPLAIPVLFIGIAASLIVLYRIKIRI